jgi:aspartate racemase
MMPAAPKPDELLSLLHGRGVQLWVENGKLRYRGSAEVLTPDLLSQLRRQKSAIIEFLDNAQRTPENHQPLVRSARPAQLPLSYAQERLWFLDQLEPGNVQYNVPTGLRLTGRLEVAVLQACLNQIVRRHEVLRTRYTMVTGQPQQIIEPAAPLSLQLLDISQFPEPQRALAATRRCNAEAQRPFALADGPVLRATLIRLGAEEHILLLVMHHIATDGWSISVLLRELTALYQALCESRPSPLADLPFQYADYAIWQRAWLPGEVLAQQLEYWKKQLAEAPERLALPTDRPRPVAQSHRGALRQRPLPPSLAVALTELSRREGVSLFMLLLAAFQTLLQRYTSLEDVVVGSPFAGRNQSELESLVGFFVNTLVLRGNLSGDPSFRTMLQRTREMTLGAYAHQDLPFEKLVAALRPERDPGHTPLFQVMFVLQNAPTEAARLAGLEVAPVSFENITAKFDLTLFVWEGGEGLKLEFEYNTDLFAAATVDRLLGHYQVLLEGIITNPEARLAELPLMAEAERRQVLAEWNQTATDYPREKSIHQLFAEQAEKAPDAVAVVFEDQQLTYRELNERANQLAHHLQKLGVRPETLVGICVERSLEMVVGLLGILKAGGAYVPLDPAYPQERLAFMIADAGVPVLLTMKDVEAKIPAHSGKTLRLDTDWPLIAKENLSNPTSPVTAASLAYVIYTSGSTGRPKGTLIPHRGVVRLVRGQNYAAFDSQQRFLQLASISFDASTFELWGALLNGAQCVIYPKGLPDFENLEKIIRHHHVTCLWLTAGLFNQIIDLRPSVLETVAHVLTGGEALSVPHIKKAMKRLPALRLTNGYGPTESTTFTTTYTVGAGETFSTGSVPIGRPLASTRCYLLDARLQPVPVGVPAELYIAGDGLARGYLNRPELTAEKFVADPFSQDPKARLYRTGDRCRWLADGSIEFLGRLDEQVKIRGFRIELGEIETTLGQHPAVRESAVVVQNDRTENKRLVAYVVSRNGRVATGDLREFLSQKLPDYMVPAIFVALDSLPLTANGKVDRNALPIPEPSEINIEPGAAAPNNYSEQILHGIWCEILHLKRVGMQDNFFELGGHSLLAVRLMEEINKRLKVTLPIPIFFQNPTIEKLAGILEKEHLVGNRPQLMPLQAGQSAGTLFLLDAGIGLCRLADQFNPGPASFATVIPLSPKAFRAASSGDLAHLPSVEELAAPHTALILNHSQPGPCLLAGHSFGGLLAFEVAHQLQRAGRPVEMIFLLDSWVGSLPWWKKIRVLNLNRAKKSLAFRANRLWRKTQAEVSRVLERPAVLFGDPSRSTAHLADVNAPFGQVPWEVLSRVYRHAQKNYQLRPLASRAVLFRAQDSEFNHLFALDGNLGWSGLFRDGLEVVDIPGDHFTLLKSPNLQLLVQQLQTRTEKLKFASAA